MVFYKIHAIILCCNSACQILLLSGWGTGYKVQLHAYRIFLIYAYSQGVCKNPLRFLCFACLSLDGGLFWASFSVVYSR